MLSELLFATNQIKYLILCQEIFFLEQPTRAWVNFYLAVIKLTNDREILHEVHIPEYAIVLEEFVIIRSFARFKHFYFLVLDLETFYKSRIQKLITAPEILYLSFVFGLRLAMYFFLDFKKYIFIFFIFYFCNKV